MQLSLLADETISDKVIRLLKSGWYSTTQMVMEIGAQSADRRLRDIKKRYKVIERLRPDHIVERHIEDII